MQLASLPWDFECLLLVCEPVVPRNVIFSGVEFSYSCGRYYKNNTDSIEETGQPPEGFLLMWVGHWKR